MSDYAVGLQLAQVRPANTNNATAYTATKKTEVLSICVCETSGTARTFRVFHDDDGSTMSEATALYFNAALAANETMWLSGDVIGGGLTVAANGTIGVQSSFASAITFTLYGVISANPKTVAP